MSFKPTFQGSTCIEDSQGTPKKSIQELQDRIEQVKESIEKLKPQYRKSSSHSFKKTTGSAYQTMGSEQDLPEGGSCINL